MVTEIVRTEELTREFKRAAKQPGLAGAARHLIRPRYETVTAVDRISLRIEPGESVAYVGPNGAGKSTTIKLLTGILVPTSGQVTVCGLQPHTDRQRNARNISVVFGQRTQLWWDIPVAESLRLLGDIYQVPEAEFRSTMDDLVGVLDLGPLLNVPARQLSLGQRMRCDLGAALVHRPEVLFLDEPTIGLDVAVKARLREFIRLMQDRHGLTVMLTSHDLGDIEELCRRMIMIDRGRIVYDGPYAEITSRFGWEKKIMITLGGEAVDDPAGRIATVLAPIGATVAQAEPGSLEVTFDGRRATSGEVIRDLTTAVRVSDLTIEETSAETIIRRLYDGELSFDSDDPPGPTR